MPTERLSPAALALLTDAAKERAHALRRAAVSDALDTLMHGLRRAALALAARVAAVLRGTKAPRQLEA